MHGSPGCLPTTPEVHPKLTPMCFVTTECPVPPYQRCSLLGQLCSHSIVSDCYPWCFGDEISTEMFCIPVKALQMASTKPFGFSRSRWGQPGPLLPKQRASLCASLLLLQPHSPYPHPKPTPARSLPHRCLPYPPITPHYNAHSPLRPSAELQTPSSSAQPPPGLVRNPRPAPRGLQAAPRPTPTGPRRPPPLRPDSPPPIRGSPGSLSSSSQPLFIFLRPGPRRHVQPRRPPDSGPHRPRRRARTTRHRRATPGDVTARRLAAVPGSGGGAPQKSRGDLGRSRARRRGGATKVRRSLGRSRAGASRSAPLFEASFPCSWGLAGTVQHTTRPCVQCGGARPGSRLWGRPGAW